MKTKKEHKQYVVAKVHAPAKSSSIPGTTKSIVELLDIDNNFEHCFTYISENNYNYVEWEKLYNEDYKDTAFVIEGFFASKGKKHNSRHYYDSELINADAKFQIKERADRQQLLYLIAKKLELL